MSQKKVTDGKAVSLKPKILTGEEAAKLTQTTTSSTTTTKTTETKTYQVDDPTKFDVRTNIKIKNFYPQAYRQTSNLKLYLISSFCRGP